MIEDLTQIGNDMAALLPLFKDGGNLSGLILPTEHSATFKALAIEAVSILEQEFGKENGYSANLIHAVNSGTGGFVGGPSYASVEEASKIVHASVRAIKRKPAQPPATSPNAKPYVDPTRISALQSLSGGSGISPGS